MLTNKTLNANVDPSAIGGTYTWSAESCTCVTACNDVSFTSTTGTVVSTNFSTTVTYPDDCTSIIIKLTIITVEGEEQCVSTFFYNIVNELGGTELTWSCESNEVGCTQIPSQNQIFETEYDCLNCTTCPCSTSNVCQDATFQAAYDCDTYELTITSANQIDWCTVPYPVIETVNIVLNHTQGTYTHAETINLPCNTALPLVIDLTANPLPAGVYFVDIIVQLNGCQVLVNSLFVNCPTGGGDVYNIDCCIGQITGSAHVDQQNNPPVVYTYHFNTPLTQDIIIDLDTAQIVDKLSVYSTWNNALLTGTEIATTNYIGHCGECCNTQYHPYTVGYFERNYNGVTPTPPVDSPHRTCNNGTYTGGTTPVPGGFSFGGYLDFGKARLVLTPTYVNSLGLIDNILYIVMYNNGTANTYDEFGNLTCSCNTVWSFRVKCDDNCPCGETGAPEIVILPKVCEVSSGELIIVTPCLSLTGHMQWSLDGITWIEGEPMYIALPGITGVTQTLYTRCVSDTDYSCYSDVTQTTFSKPDCCSGLLDFTVECNPITEGLYNQIDYKYRVIYYIPSCDDTENPDIVSPLYGSPVDNDYQYIVGFNDNAVTVEVYFNETSPYFFSIACNICQTPMYWASNSDDIQNAISNLLINHACEPCNIVLDPRYDLGSSSFYISLDNDFGTADFPSIPQGQPPYTLTVSLSGLITTSGILVTQNTLPLTTITPNISDEYLIFPYYPTTGMVQHSNLNYGFFIGISNLGIYTINVTDYDNCIAEATICVTDLDVNYCVSNAASASLQVVIPTDYFTGITVNGVTYNPAPIILTVDEVATTAALYNYLNTAIPNEFFSIEYTNMSEVLSILKITYYSCDLIADLNISTTTTPTSIYADEEGTTFVIWTAALLPAIPILTYSWTLSNTMTLVAGTTDSSSIVTQGGGNITLTVTTDDCGIIGGSGCRSEIEINSCETESIKIAASNIEDYYFKGVVINGITYPGANIQLVDSLVTPGSTIAASILSFLNANVIPNIGGVWYVQVDNILPDPVNLTIRWLNCEGTIVSIQILLNLSDNITTANTAINTTVNYENSHILSITAEPNVPILSYLWTLTGLTLITGTLTDASIAVSGGGTAEITVELTDCGTATTSSCIAEITAINEICDAERVVTGTFTTAGDNFVGVTIGATAYTIAVSLLISNSPTLALAIYSALNSEVAPIVGGYFYAEFDENSFYLTVYWTACNGTLSPLSINMLDVLNVPYASAPSVGSTSPFGLKLYEAIIAPAGALFNDAWTTTGTVTVQAVISQTEAFVEVSFLGGTLSYEADIEDCGTADITIAL